MRNPKRSRRRFGNIERLESRLMLAGDNGPHDFDPDYDLNAFHIHADLSIWVNSERVAIPKDIGIDATGFISPIHTHEADNELHIHNINGEVPDDFLTLGDFFDTWRTLGGLAGNNADSVLTDTQLFDETVDGEHSLQMFVNGVSVSENFADYQIHDGDNIILVYTSNPVVTVDFNTGPVVIELFANPVTNPALFRAGTVGPVNVSATVDNFLDILNNGEYDNMFLHRLSPNFVIQGGGFTTATGNVADLDQIAETVNRPAILDQPGLSNLAGTIAMARSGPNTATNEAYVNLVDNTFLDTQDGGFTVFGQVLDMAAIDTISQLDSIVAVEANLSGAAEVPPVSTAATGTATLVYNQNTDAFDLNVFVQGITKLDLTSSALFEGELGVDGTQIFNLGDGSLWIEEAGGLRRTITDVFPSGSITELLDTGGGSGISDIYISIGTTANPGGEIRGQFRRSDFSRLEGVPVTADSQFVFVESVGGQGTIQGLVFSDMNGDGILNEEDSGISDVTVFIDANNDGVHDPGEISTATDSNGEYFFHLPSGSYTVRQIPPVNFVQTVPTTPDSYTVILEIGDVATAIDFGNDPEFENMLSGFVYFDTNNNGIFDDGESPLAGVTVTLEGIDDSGDEINQVQITKEDGSYKFNNVAPGTYTITQTQPAFLLDGRDTIGSQGGDDSVNDVLGITLIDGTTGVDNNFGERGRSAEYSLLSDFIVLLEDLPDFANRFDDTILVAVSPTGGQSWSTPGGGWSDFTSIEVDIASDESTITLTVTDRLSGQEQSVTIPFVDSRVREIGRVDDVVLIRLEGDFQAFGLAAPSNTFLLNENSVVGTRVGKITPPADLVEPLIYEFVNPDQPEALNLAANDHLSGDVTAPVVLIEYLSLQCPHCADIHSTIEQLETEFAGDLLVVRRHQPLSGIFGNAFDAAVAAEAAGRQNMFDEMVDLLFENQADWSAAADPQPFFDTYATQLGLNLTQFHTDQADPALADRVTQDVDGATSLGVDGTPTFFLNGEEITTPGTQQEFSSLIQTAIDEVDDVFSLNRRTGELFVAQSEPLDFETTPTFTLNVNISNGSTSTTAVDVRLNDVFEF